MLVGSHVSMSGKEMLLWSAKEAASYHATAMMVYTGAPQNTKRKPIEELQIPQGQAFMAEHGIREVVVHAPYIINLANTTKAGYLDFAIDFLREEIRRAQAIGASQVVLHPGSHVGAGVEVGLSQIVKALNEVLDKKQTVQIALETMAGKGTELGRTFDEIARMMDGVVHNDLLSVTFDTCHVHDAGYPLKEDVSGVLTEFDKIIGLDRLKVLHVNDSKNPCGSHKDRHANIGFGEIGFDALMEIVYEEQFKSIPKILETPYVGEDKKHQKAPYLYELDMIRRRVFDPQLLTKISKEA